MSAPTIVATNGESDVINRGSYYAILKKGQPISSIKRWEKSKLASRCIFTGGYDVVNPPKPYKEGE